MWSTWSVSAPKTATAFTGCDTGISYMVAESVQMRTRPVTGLSAHGPSGTHPHSSLILKPATPRRTPQLRAEEAAPHPGLSRYTLQYHQSTQVPPPPALEVAERGSDRQRQPEQCTTPAMAPASEKHAEAGQTLLAAATAAVLAVEHDHEHTSNTAVFSTDSIASTVTLPSRQTSQMVEEEDDANAPPMHIHRVASEQLLPRTNELTPGAAAVRVPSVSMGRVTVTSRRRQRNPRRFVVTELPPEQDELLFLSDSGEAANEPKAEPRSERSASGTSCPVVEVPTETSSADAAPPKTSRPGKMEVRGRFTIIDLSPDSATATEDEKPTRDAGSVLRGSSVTMPSTSVRRRPPPRRLSRSERASSSTSIGSVSAAGISIADLENGNSLSHSRGPEDKESHGHAVDLPRYRPPTQQSPMRVDLSALDRHLVFLQQESHDMKALLESMISSNARWISALSASSDSDIGSGKNPKAVHPASTPLVNGFSAPSVVPSMAMMREPTLEEKYERLHKAFMELEEKHAATVRENVQLQRHNIMLDTRLRQEMSVNDELRAHVDQLTQYTESLIIGGDTPTGDEQQQSHLTESMSSASTEISADAEQRKPQGSQPPLVVEPPTNTVGKAKHHERTISDMSIASSALWMMDNNQSGLEDEDDDDDGCGVDVDVDDTDNDDDQSVQAKLARYRRRLRILSRSTSMDDSASSVYSSSYRDSWMSVLDPHHRSSTSDWRSMSFDAGADNAVVDEDLLDAIKRRHQRLGSSDDGTVITGDNQTDEQHVARLEPWQRRRKSSSMIVEELVNPEDDPPASGVAE